VFASATISGLSTEFGLVTPIVVVPPYGHSVKGMGGVDWGVGGHPASELRYSVPPFKGVVAVKAREEIIAEIRVETFVIEVWITISAALHGPERPWRNLRRRAIIVDPWIAGRLRSQGRRQLILEDLRSDRTI